MKGETNMRIENIKDIIKKVLKQESSYKSILIDGKWGCGKTTIIKKAIIDLKKEEWIGKNIIYQSLFGVKDINELSKCFSYIGTNALRLSKSIVTPFVQMVPYVGDRIKDCLDNVTTEFNVAPSNKKNKIFIFDDLERVDPHLSYVSLLGFFNQLLLNGSKIICISSLSDLHVLDSDKEKEMSYFIEKLFDRIFYINEAPSNIILSIFKDLEPYYGSFSPYVDMFDDNIRLAIKTQRLLMDVKNNANKYEYDLNKNLTKEQIVKATICSIKAIYKNINVGEKKKSENEKEVLPVSQLASIELDGELNKTVRSKIIREVDNGIYFEDEKSTIKRLAIDLSYIEVHDDYSELRKSHPLKVAKKETGGILEGGSIYYLNDEGQKEFFEEFKNKTMNKELIINRWYIDRLIEIIKYTEFDLHKDGLMKTIEDAIVSQALNGDDEAYRRLEDYSTFPNETKGEKRFEELFNNVSTRLTQHKNNSLEEEINNDVNNDDYGSLNDLLYDIINYKKTEDIRHHFDDLILQNNFYLPNLEKGVTQEEWSYCHQMAKYCANKDFKEAFIKCLINLCKQFPNERSLRDKCEALIKYNLTSEDLNVFNGHLDR